MGDVRSYLTKLADERNRRRIAMLESRPETHQIAKSYDFPAYAWEGAGPYTPAQTGDGEPVPDITIKVPTGGGKTLIACHAIGEIQRIFLRSLHGLVVWIVPSTQIYRQTLEALCERDHPYRAALENAVGANPDCIKIVQREEPLSPTDLTGRLTVLLLMLPAASGKAKQTLRMYRDAGNYERFFPADDDDRGHKRLISDVPNLDKYSHELLAPRVMTSLANLLRISRPLILIDEGHKAYSPGARNTVLGLNPSFILQLTATPKHQANVLTGASGADLDREEMVKIPIHVTPSMDDTSWTTTLLRAKLERDRLEAVAVQHRKNTGRYIRPICLIQVERTGSDQATSGFIHARQVEQYLIAHCGVPEHQVATKTSEKDEIEGRNLLSEQDSVRYIITRQALQEGWDCSFAYILVVLTNPTSRVGMTQLLGRVLRQPDAKRTEVPALNMSRVFAFRTRADALLAEIKVELEKEGLGDLSKHVLTGSAHAVQEPAKAPKIKGKLMKFEGRLFLPLFAAKRRGRWEPIDFEADILAFVDWDLLDGEKIASRINLAKRAESVHLKHLTRSASEQIESAPEGIAGFDPVFFAKELNSTVTNAWRAWDLAHDILSNLAGRYGKEKIRANFVHILEESRKQASGMVDSQCEGIFRDRLKKGEIRFRLLAHDKGNALGKIRSVAKSSQFEIEGASPGRGLMSLYDQHDFNRLERDVAICLDRQERLLWWHRMATGAGYRVQGWKRHRVHPDFLAARDLTETEKQAKIFVIETKGLHLKNEDTDYKRALFDLCNRHTPVSKSWADMGLGFREHVFEFQVVFSDEWENTLTGLFE